VVSSEKVAQNSDTSNRCQQDGVVSADILFKVNDQKFQDLSVHSEENQRVSLSSRAEIHIKINRGRSHDTLPW
jgi:hypothetical protein